MLWLRLCALVSLVVLTACQRDEAGDVRTRVALWFDLDRQIYFKSEARCTVAVYELKTLDIKDIVPIASNATRAVQAFRQNEVTGVRMEKYSPHDLADAMLLEGDGAFGKEVMRAGARSVDCMRGSFVEDHLRGALTRAGATLVFDKKTEAAVIFDPVQERVYFLAGDVL